MKKTIIDPIDRTVGDLRALRDEIRLNLHLFEMDARNFLGDPMRPLRRRLDAARRAAERSIHPERPHWKEWG